MSGSGSYYSSEEDEYETEYTDESAAPPPKASQSSVAAPAAAADDEESSDLPTPTAKLPANVLRDVRSPVAPQNSANSTMTRGNVSTSSNVSQTRREEEEDEEEGEYEDEDEWETASDSEQPPPFKAPPAPAAAPVAAPQPSSAAIPKSARSGARTPKSARSGARTPKTPKSPGTVTGSDWEDEDEEEYTDESDSDVVASGAMWELVSSALTRPSFVTAVQRMFSGDSVAKSVIARDVVTVTTPTRHMLVVLRNAIRSEMQMRETFSSAGSFYQDVLYHTLARAGASFFRMALSPTVRNMATVTVDIDINPLNVTGSKLEANQMELRRLADLLFDDLFSAESKAAVPRILRASLRVAREETKGNENLITAFVATNILARLLSDPTGSKMTPSVTRVALANLGRLAKLASALAVPDPSLGTFFSAWCVKQAARLSAWVAELAIDPTGTNFAAELAPMAGLPQKERELVNRFATEIGTLKQWLTTGQKERSGGLTAEEKPVLEMCLSLLRPLAVEGSGGSSSDPIRSVRNPHRRVPHEIPLLQKEILGLEKFSLDGNGRKLISQGPVVARKKNREEDGHLFLFSDLLLYCKHNPVEQKQLFTFSRAYRLHQVVVRMLPESERAAAAAFCVSAFAMPSGHDLTFFAANARDKDRWVELIRKKQTDLRLATLKVARKFLANEVVKNGRQIPVELAMTDEVLMKVVPQTDNVISSFDFQQLREWKTTDDELIFDFNAATEDSYIEDLVLRLRGDRIGAIAAEVARSKAAGEKSHQNSRAALPSFRQKQGSHNNLKAASAAAAAAAAGASSPKSPKKQQQQQQPQQLIPPKKSSGHSVTVEPLDEADILPQRSPPPSTNPGAKNQSSSLTRPPATYMPDDDKGRGGVVKAKVVDRHKDDNVERVAMTPTKDFPPMTIVDKRGKEHDGWAVFGGDSQTKPREQSEARAKRQRDKERRAQAREKAADGRNHRLDEDKRIFMEALEQSMKNMVAPVDDAALRRPEELTDAEILGLQKRAYKWKRENRLLKELLYTQYVVSQKNSK